MSKEITPSYFLSFLLNIIKIGATGWENSHGKKEKIAKNSSSFVFHFFVKGLFCHFIPLAQTTGIDRRAKILHINLFKSSNTT